MTFKRPRMVGSLGPLALCGVTLFRTEMNMEAFTVAATLILPIESKAPSHLSLASASCTAEVFTQFE